MGLLLNGRAFRWNRLLPYPGEALAAISYMTVRALFPGSDHVQLLFLFSSNPFTSLFLTISQSLF